MRKFLKVRASMLIALLLVALTLSCVSCIGKDSAKQDTSTTENESQSVETTDSANTQDDSETTKPSGGASQGGTSGGDVDDSGNEPNNSNSDKGPTENDLPIIWG